MENKNSKNNTGNGDKPYTQDDLLQDIYDSEDTESTLDYKNKLKFLQFILITLVKYDFENNDTDDIKNQIECQIDEDILMFGYTFFLSANRNFKYTWSYLLRQKDNYADFLLATYKFISYAIKDINTMRESLKSYEDLHIELNELFDVTFIDEEPYVKTEVNWDNLKKINEVKRGYRIIVKKNETTILGFNREYGEVNLETLIENIKKLYMDKNIEKNKDSADEQNR